MPSNNNRIDDPNEADLYLTQWITSPSGRQERIDNKRGQEGHTVADITQDGDYSVFQINESGDKSDLVQGSHKFYADSSTRSLAKGSDSYSDQTYEKHQNGKLTESGGGNFHAVDGDHIDALSQNKKTFATGGNGLHTVEGDQTFITNSGRVDNYGEQGFSIQSGQEILIGSTQDLAVQVGTNEGHIVNANLSFDALGSAYINSKGQLNLAGLPLVTLSCGSPFSVGGIAGAAGAPSSIIMTPASITFKVGATVMSLTPAGLEINAPTIFVNAEASLAMHSEVVVIAGDESLTLASAGETAIQGTRVFIN